MVFDKEKYCPLVVGYLLAFGTSDWDLIRWGGGGVDLLPAGEL